uniref:Peptidase S1 domain-containing protein n=1 Tax=Trichuris muris TaxID=70415 RepID=A0A5S6QJA4_TRIMR
MIPSNPWALAVLIPLVVVAYSEGTPCGYPKAYGGENIAMYLQDNKMVFPWTVVVTGCTRQLKCIGSLIPEEGASSLNRNGSSLVLTAGNCFRRNFFKKWGSPSSYRVYAGMDRYNLFTGGAKDASVIKLRIYPFNAGSDNIWHGVALVALKKPLMFSKAISPVCLAQQLVPPDSSRCFVSTYVKSRLDEEVVDLVPGSLCNFGHFPELKKIGGICSVHGKASSTKHFGGPLVCLVNNRAYQFGIYLSQLTVKQAFTTQIQALHYYGHTTKLFSNDAATLTYTVLLESKSGKSVSSKDHSQIENQSNEDDESSKPTETLKPTVPPEQKKQVLCGSTSVFGRKTESYIQGENARDMFPWNVYIVTKTRGIVRCIGSVIHAGDYAQHANASNLVLTAARCFDQTTTSSGKVLSSRLIYASSNKYSWYKRKGIKLTVVKAYGYNQRIDKREPENALIILQLQRPLSTKDNVVPVCLAAPDELPPLESYCYVTHYDTNEHRIDEEAVPLALKRKCSLNGHLNSSSAQGLCTIQEKRKNYLLTGAPLVCIIDGRAYQYGVYQRQHMCRINDKATQSLGFYSQITTVYDMLSCKSPAQRPDSSNVPPAVKETEQTAPTERPPIIFLPIDSESLSLDSLSKEQQTTKEPSVSVVLPSRPLPPSSSHPNNQSGQQPLQPVNGKSDSSSVSISKSKSASTERSNEESEERIVPPKTPTPEVESPVLKRNETTIVVRFPQLTYPKFVIREETTEKPIIVSSGSSESEEIVIPITLPALVSTPSPDTVPSEPVLSTPAPVKIDGDSKPSSHSRTTSASSSKTTSTSGELIDPNEVDIPLPKPGLPNIPCINPGDYDFDIFVPSGLPMCPGNADGSVQLVPLPTPIPSAEYPSSSLESADHKVFLTIPPYDTIGKVTDHEHILIRDVVVAETAVAGVTSSVCVEGVSSSHPSAISDGTSSGSNIYGSSDPSYPAIGTPGNTSSGTSSSGGNSSASTSTCTPGSTSSNCSGSKPGVFGCEGSLIKHLPGAVGVHIFDVSMTSAEDSCTGSLYTEPGQTYSDLVIASARCVWSRVSTKYQVYIGSLLPREMAAAQFNRTLVSVDRILTVPFYSEHSSLKAMGIAVLKLKHKVKVTAGVQSFPLSYPETAPSMRMQCYVSGVCQHGMPVRVEYQLLSPSDCYSRLGHQFHPSLQYCGVGRKNTLKYPVGAPLICEYFGTWTQFAVYDHSPRSTKMYLGTQEEDALNELAVFVKFEGDVVRETLKKLQA